MSRYTVLSTPEAEDDLATMWTDADDRKQVSEAANAADRLLAENPLRDSVYLSEQLRRLDGRCDSTSNFVRMIELS